MKKIIGLIVLGIVTMLNADYIEAKQNFKALYKDVELSSEQKRYLHENQYENLQIINKTLEKEKRKLNQNYLNEKNVIEYVLTKDRNVKNIKFLNQSNNREIDQFTKNIILSTSKKFDKPNEDTLMRYIFYYQIGKVQNNNTSSRSNETYYKTIQKGTTRFFHRSEEYVRVFETSEDGYVNINVNPYNCMRVTTLLKDNGKRIAVKGLYQTNLNQEIIKGRYKLLLKTQDDCDVSIQYK